MFSNTLLPDTDYNKLIKNLVFAMQSVTIANFVIKFVAGFAHCCRKSDNQIGVYDRISQTFYYETYHVGSGYNITAGPCVN